MDISLETRVQRILKLNLDPIKVKLMESEEGKGWTRQQCDAAELWYKRFLELNLRYPLLSIVPTKEIDEFWHFHILDTEKYAFDCEHAFGYFLHHFPYFGMRGPEDRKNLEDSFGQTKSLFESHFGQGLGVLKAHFTGASELAKCDGSNCSEKDCSKCGQSCTSEKCNPKAGKPRSHTFSQESTASACDSGPNCYGQGCNGQKCGKQIAERRPTLPAFN